MEENFAFIKGERGETEDRMTEIQCRLLDTAVLGRIRDISEKGKRNVGPGVHLFAIRSGIQIMQAIDKLQFGKELGLICLKRS